MGATIALDALSLRQGRNQNHETEIVSSLIDQQLLVFDSQSMSRQKRRAVIVTVTSTITPSSLPPSLTTIERPWQRIAKKQNIKLFFSAQSQGRSSFHRSEAF